MTENERLLLEALTRTCGLNTREDVETYVATALALPESSDPECLRQMLLCLRDVDAGEVQYELLEACERFPTDVYVRVVAEQAEAIHGSAPQWFELAFHSLLNSSECVDALKSQMNSLAPEVRGFIIETVKEYADSYPKYQGVLNLLG